jgi:alpha-L-fucosidase 2
MKCCIKRTFVTLTGEYYQDILPALPSALPSGKISGIRGRGGFELAITWKNGILETVEVKSLQGNKLHLRYQGKILSKETSTGEKLAYSHADFK